MHEQTSSAPPRARVLMVQGTASHAGKSTLVTALCRVYARRGWRVAPFKAQNMSNNAAVTSDGGEIGRAQAVQALAAGVDAHVDMNPVLLKPQSDRTSQVVVLGKPWANTAAREFYARKAELWPIVTAALDRLRERNDLVIIEGAGSPAEINLAQYDLVNMRVARHADAPVLLVADIDRGGVFASLYGTVSLLPPDEQRLIRGFVINKFRGDPSLLTPGFGMLEERVGIPTIGVLPYTDMGDVPAEDGVELDEQGGLIGLDAADAALDVVVLRLPRIANLDEFQPLARTTGVQVRFVRDTAAFGAPDLVIIPGTKSTIDDLEWLCARGLDKSIVAAHAGGTPILGICGGYQMLGLRLHDPQGVDGRVTSVAGLGLLPVETVFAPEKITKRVSAQVARSSALLPEVLDASLAAYEIHMGRTSAVPGAAAAHAFLIHDDTGHAKPDGVVSADGLVIGTYLHGLFANRVWRHAVMAAVARRHGITMPLVEWRSDDGVACSGHDMDPRAHRAIDALADLVEHHLDMAFIDGLIGATGRAP